MKHIRKWVELREYRRQNALSAQSFASKLGVSMMTVYRWENGKSTPHPFLREKIKRMINKGYNSGT